MRAQSKLLNYHAPSYIAGYYEFVMKNALVNAFTAIPNYVLLIAPVAAVAIWGIAKVQAMLPPV